MTITRASRARQAATRMPRTCRRGATPRISRPALLVISSTRPGAPWRMTTPACRARSGHSHRPGQTPALAWPSTRSTAPTLSRTTCTQVTAVLPTTTRAYLLVNALLAISKAALPASSALVVSILTWSPTTHRARPNESTVVKPGGT